MKLDPVPGMKRGRPRPAAPGRPLTIEEQAVLDEIAAC
jgi:hypothetical protein